MQAPEIFYLASQLHQEVGKNEKSIGIYLNDPRKLQYFLDIISDLFSPTHYPVEGVYGVFDYITNFDESVGRKAKQSLYQIETLMVEIREFGLKDDRPTAIVESFRSSMAKEMELISEALQPCSVDTHWFYSRSRRADSSYEALKNKFIELIMDSNSSPFVQVVGKPGSGKSHFAGFNLREPGIMKQFHSSFYINMSSTPEQNMATHIFKRVLENCADKKCLIMLDDVPDVKTLQSLVPMDEKDYRFPQLLKAATMGTKIVLPFCLEFEHGCLGVSVVSVPLHNQYTSWKEFQYIAFGGQEKPLPSQLDVGSKICQMCGDVLAVIKVVASIMSSKSTTEEWEHFLAIAMTSVPDPVTTISSILKLTDRQCHHGLQQKWRHCFAFCSLLPKDYEFKEFHMFHLWRVLDDFSEIGGMTEEELGQCFNEFLRRRYFVPVDNSYSGLRYKINCLASELMKYVAGDEFFLVDTPTFKPYHRIIRHASFIVGPSWEPPLWLLEAKQLQSLILWPGDLGDFNFLTIVDFTLLRQTDIGALHADAVHCERLPIFLVKFESWST